VIEALNARRYKTVFLINIQSSWPVECGRDKIVMTSGDRNSVAKIALAVAGS
jgi:hypothetical protein